MMVDNELQLSLISNDPFITMHQELYSNLLHCNGFIFSVAFISYGGLQLLLRYLDQIKESGVQGKILTSDYQNFTDPKALRKLQEFPNITTKVFLEETQGGFHTKAYIFDYNDEVRMIIGSSNITEKALLKNVEWNVKIISKKTHPFVYEIMAAFNILWEKTQVIDEDFLERYEKLIELLKEADRNKVQAFSEFNIKPNSLQTIALKNLDALRKAGEDRGLVIAATATGKTYLSAFDVQQVKPKRLLFLVHREDILNKAQKSFKRIFGDRIDSGTLSGSKKELGAKYLFSTIQSMNHHYNEFRQDEFDYIIVDETHHAMADGYQNILNYFKPKFLLGMTATPERTDGLSLFSFFKNNVAIDVRLYQAIEESLVSPFHYFGIREYEGVDLADLTDSEIDKLTERLSIPERVEYIHQQMELFGYSGDKLRCLAFCASVEHAKFMSDAFNNKGMKSVCLSGEDDVVYREMIMNDFESSRDDRVKVIFTRDVFNEGIDIPSINVVLMLRPTQSPIVFIQQLGRGLRNHPGKEFVTIIDFISNYRKSFMMAIALKGQRYIDKESVMISVQKGFTELPGDSFVHLDEIAKEEILKQLSKENFRKISYLRDDYFSFKRLNEHVIPVYLTEYELVEGSPDPIKFIDYAHSYLDFLSRVESIDALAYLDLSNEFMRLIRQISSSLPLKRPIEFLILKAILQYKHLSRIDSFNLVSSQFQGVTQEAFDHALINLYGKLLDSSQKRRYTPMIILSDNFIDISPAWQKTLSPIHSSLYEDTLKYGLLRYQREFESIPYSKPFFKLYGSYSMTDAALLNNSNKILSSYRGTGLLSEGNEFFLYIDLHKEEGIRASINYKDKVLNRETFQWQTPNSTKQGTKRADDILMNSQRNINLHIFVRKTKKVDGVVQPYIYLGKADTYDYDRNSNKPITVFMKLRNPIPEALFRDLTYFINPNQN